jgi:hypothetical protein
MVRHPEAAAKAALEGCGRGVNQIDPADFGNVSSQIGPADLAAVVLRGSLPSHLRMTEMMFAEPEGTRIARTILFLQRVF